MDFGQAFTLGRLSRAAQDADEAEANLEVANSRIRAQNARLAELEDALALKTAEAAGREAQLDAFMAQHPDNPLMADSGKRFKKSGNVKRQVRLVFEAAFDAALAKLGVDDPASRRLD